jgi:FKBP-type peptidyl-prolyl cis-trans isomerase
MKKTTFLSGSGVFLAATLALLILAGCRGGSAGKSDGSTGDTSYALGMEFGQSVREAGFSIDYDAFLQGFKDTFEGRTPRMSSEDAGMKIQSAFLAAQEKQSEGLKQGETDFLAENARKAGIQTTASGLQYEVISEGQGEKPQLADTVRVNYEGTLISGEVFDSSYERGEPIEFPLDGVIPGWSEGLQLMTEGANYRFYIPSELAYGPQGIPGAIPPYSALIFKVELIAIIK